MGKAQLLYNIQEILERVSWYNYLYLTSYFMPGYNPKRSANWNYGGAKWKLSRSKIELFTTCPRCFYMDNKLGVKRPSMPSFLINTAVDTQLKNEFDAYRRDGKAHPFQK